MTSSAEPSQPGRPPASAWQVSPDRKFSLDDIIPGPVLRVLVSIVRLPAGPIILALLFGLIALPSALLIRTYDMSDAQAFVSDRTLDPLSPAVLLAALGAILAAVCVAAPIGWLIVRRHLILGGLITILVAWITAIVALPFLPSLAGLSYGAVDPVGDGATAPVIVGIGGGLDELSRGFPDAFVLGLVLSGLVGALSLVALVLGVGIWAPLVRRRRA